MGHKLVCFNCRVARNLSLDISSWESKNKFCVKCQSEIRILPHRFRPPKKDDVKKWETVFFLFENGFRYEHIYDDDTKNYAKIPENMREAIEFINTYKLTI
ncbi:hypothetical protein LNP04_08555 [Chryseobacterium sp. C-71]|uniref:hypothetical protein n=1 Tax=Chryseobacterium sp. C-71 TaxID=2893882 RepID=UPI001E529052|nr:hypothetical protein [Chryseobacterium sp. C-71]UFH33731.1 hypothetical protein LNP04_08555 [Chryseobacterium sp. C-71]